MDGSPTRRIRARRAAAGAWGGGDVALPVLALGVLGGLALMLTEFATVASVEIPGRTCREVADVGAADRCELTGFDRHGGALLLLGAFSGFMALGAGRARSRPAAIALIAIAALALAIALLRDLPEAGRSGAVGITYEGAEGRAGIGLYMEIAGGLLVAAAGMLSLVRGPPPVRAHRPHT